MKYLNEYNDFEWDEDDFDEEEEEYHDMEVGDNVYLPMNHPSMSTSQHEYTKNGYVKGLVDGRYKPFNHNYKWKGIVDEITFKKDGTKVMRLKDEWPFREVKNWVRYVNQNENFDFNDDDFDEEEYDTNYKLVVLEITEDGETFLYPQFSHSGNINIYIMMNQTGKYSYDMYNIDKKISPYGKFITAPKKIVRKVINNEIPIQIYQPNETYVKTKESYFRNLPEHIQTAISPPK